jgi:hypothetical protein
MVSACMVGMCVCACASMVQTCPAGSLYVHTDGYDPEFLMHTMHEVPYISHMHTHYCDMINSIFGPIIWQFNHPSYS